MKKSCVKLLAALLVALLLTTLAPAALMEADVAPVEAIDEAVPEMDSVDLDAEDELPVEDGYVSDEGYMAELSSYEASGDIPIDEAHFPDAVFRSFVSNWDNNRDGALSDSECKNVNGFGMANAGVTSLKGLEYFPNLESLDCRGNSGLTSLDVSKYTKLKSLVCSGCGLTSLDVSKNTNLTSLGCHENNLTTLDVSNCPDLQYLVCYSNQLTSLNVSGCTSLEALGCTANALTSLDVSGFSKLKTLYCDFNQLTALNVSGCYELDTLYCNDNQLTSLELSGYTKLNNLLCFRNKLQSLNLSGCTELNKLSCYSDQLTSLNIDGCNNLTQLSCHENNLTSVDVTKCPGFADRIRGGYFSEGRLLSISGGTEVVCDNISFIGADIYATPAVPEGFTVVKGKTNAEVKISGKSTATKTTATVAAAPGSVTQLDFGGAKATKIKSSEKKIATVNSKGVVTFKKAGKVKITYKVGKKTHTVVLKVTDPTMPKSIKLDQSGTVAAKVGEKTTLKATLNEGAKSGIQWSTSDKKVATVKNGVVTFKKAGKVTITATTKRGSKKAKVKFTVSK